ncbi:hypothetical protein K438DRAFT_1965304 [Mycena galopus ATCC 62051]|nr:hypothetical protein K438DRAFT_1965304 [Mycena galopus ATCC 62051]
MAASRRGVDLKAVGKIFHDTLATIQDDTPDIVGLKPQAVEWLTAARYKLMRDIESNYYQLEALRDKPLTRPQWMIRNSGQPLSFQTNAIPTLLDPYKPAFCDNLRELLKSSGFEHHTVSNTAYYYNAISITINFPAQAALVAAAQEQQAPSTLHVEDEFSRAAKGKGRAEIFAASKLGRLLIGARGESAGVVSTARTSRKRGRKVKEEEDAADEEVVVDEETGADGGRKLRSVTRASSTATLRSSIENPRRSGRKRVKQEE